MFCGKFSHAPLRQREKLLKANRIAANADFKRRLQSQFEVFSSARKRWSWEKGKPLRS